MHCPPSPWHRLLPVLGGGSVVVDLFFVVAPIVCGGSVFGPCFVIHFLCRSGFAVILMRKRELFALFQLSSWFLVTVRVL